MLQWTEIIQSQARLPDAMILKVNVYFDWHIAAPSLTIMQHKVVTIVCPLFICL